MVKKETYRPRIADKILARKLQGKGAVLLDGAKWCGKTTTAEQICRSVLYMSDPAKRAQNVQLARLNPTLLLRGDKPRLIDEWQIAPAIWDAVRFDSDHSEELGLFILIGSSVPPDMSDVIHSGTGRFGWVKMRPMSLWESGESTGDVSLLSLFEGETEVAGVSNLDIETVAFVACRGGWPLAVDMSRDVALDQAFDYLTAVERRDIQQADGVERDSSRVHRLLRSYARHQGAQVSYAALKEDLKENEADDFDTDTVASYIKVSDFKKIRMAIDDNADLIIKRWKEYFG